ncbi:RDD family protein [Demequina sp. SYSU T00192]|uniref:RDD family protein n=1 Tax=Demequina litoralis TaxID=3051660 RepID=A0ABT8G7C7_9MICO|nr:RDD family protein [Demequina sp. SYSU T00192]MDN4474907.1 RDD family protein [Demequina sp. SYSU T00192]
MTDEDAILIGEGVVLDSGAASVPLRMLSGAIDMAATFTVLFVGMSMLERAGASLNDAWARAVVITWTVACLVLAPMTVETLTRGRSLGRWAAGLRIVRDDGGPVSVRHAAARALLGVLELYGTLGMLAVTVSAFGTRGKRIGDYVAGTYAMRTRGAKRALPRLAMPVGLEGWARTADITRLGDGLALTARMFLSRAPDMHAPSRVRVGTRLSEQFATHVSPPPPAGTHPEAFLAAVLVERRDREQRIEEARMARAERDGDALRRLPFGVPDAD